MQLVCCHSSLIHVLLHAFSLKPGDFETIILTLQISNQPPLFTIKITDSREESKEADHVDKLDVRDNKAVIQSVSHIKP